MKRAPRSKRGVTNKEPILSTTSKAERTIAKTELTSESCGRDKPLSKQSRSKTELLFACGVVSEAIH